MGIDIPYDYEHRIGNDRIRIFLGEEKFQVLSLGTADK